MALMSISKRAATRIFRIATAPRKKAANAKLLHQGLPAIFAEPARYLITNKTNSNVQAVQNRVEARRHLMASKGSAPVDVLYSPKPGSAGSDVTSDLRPEPGKVMSFTMERVARTGKNKEWGTFLHILASEVEGTFLELGSCAGISGSYLATAPSCKHLFTIEGSAALARLARETTNAVAPGRVEVITGLFNDALDTVLPDLERSGINFAFIDGHHERVATLHYFERIKPALYPGSVVVFDDISWSSDMRAMWEEVALQDGVAHAADYGALGVVIYDPAASAPSYWNFQPILGRRRIGEPWGWKE